MTRRLLGVSLNHIASLRQVGGATLPDPVVIAGLVEGAGASQIKLHLREDRRHIQERDVRPFRQGTGQATPQGSPRNFRYDLERHRLDFL